MTSRERFRHALDHKEGDHVPLDCGFDVHNGIHEVAYANLIKYLGIHDDITRYDQVQHLAVVNDEVAKRIRSDCRYVFANAPTDFKFERDAEGTWLDEFGVRRKTVGLYDESFAFPLAGCDMDTVNNFEFRDPKDPARFTGLQDRAKHLYETTDFALNGGSCASLFYLSAEFVGFQEYMEKILSDRDVILRLVDRLMEWEMAFFESYLAEVGDYIEMVWIGDDWGTQQGPIMNPAIFRDYFVPRYRELTRFIKSKADVKIALHCCGSNTWALNDFIDMGIDVVHPMQGDAAHMDDPAKLKAEFGDKLVFYSNIRNQTVLPKGTPEEVGAEVKRKIEALAKGGGYIMSAGHNIQADVPPENILAFADALHKYGEYPIL